MMIQPWFIFHVLGILLFVSLAKAYSSLSDETLRVIPGPGNDFNVKTGKLLAPILRPRVSGSPGSTAVLNHFVDFFKTSLPKWNLSFQNSTSKTPATGDHDIPFVNLIASRDPPWSKPGDVGRLTLVAHYDSKLTPEGFIGATDSAAPCAMLMHAARSIDAALTKKWAAVQAKDARKTLEDHKGIQMFFLDGEEAFGQTWTHEDSLYGARSLAAEMESTPHPAKSTYKTGISSISLFVLLDLLGAKNPRVPSFFQTTHWAYRHMAVLEKRFRTLSLFKSSSKPASKAQKAPLRPTKLKPGQKNENRNKKSIPRKQVIRKEDPPFLPDIDKKDDNFLLAGTVEDDHLPFMARGVEVLHLIQVPFPRVWHHMDDDGDHLDLNTCADWAILVTAFAAEWMDLEGYFDTKNGAIKRQELDSDTVISKTEL